MATVVYPRPEERRRPWERLSDSGIIVPLIACLILIYLTALPLLMLLVGSFRIEGQEGFTLQNYVNAYTQARTWRLLGTSLLFAVGASFIAFVLGTFIAWLVERTNTPLRKWFYVLALIPIIIPGVLESIAWIYLLNPQIGWLNTSLLSILGPTGLGWISATPFNIYSLGGMIWVEALALTPLVFLLMAAAFRSMDPSLEESAMMSGAGTLTTLRRVTVRLLLPGIASTMLLMFVRGLESFEVPALIGIPGGIQVFTSEIFLSLRDFPPDFGLAGALAIGLMSISALGVWIYGRVTSRSETFSTVTGKAYRPRQLDLGRWKYAATIGMFVYFSISIGLPFFILLWYSFLPFYQVPSPAAFSFMSLENYGFVINFPRARLALQNSFILAIGAATGVSVLTAIIAWITIKTKLRGRAALDLLAFLPIGIPGLVLGVAMIWMYITLPIPIYGTIWLLILAYMTKYLPYGMRTNSASMVQISKELEEAAHISGATWWTTFRKVTLPLLKPGLLAGWTYIFVVSIRELSASILLAGPNSIVLSVLVFDLTESGRQGGVAALAVMMIVGLLIVVGIVHRISGQFGIRAG